MKKSKTQKGITLVALIITIVVLLILAAVAINAIKNDDILQYANNSASKYNQAQVNEQETLDGYLGYIENGGSTEKIIGDATEGIKVDKISTINGKMYSANNPVIPAGFKAINTTAANWDVEDLAAEVKKGLVISDGTSEFVWIPVANINEMVKVTSGKDTNGRTNYEGIMYDFSKDSDGTLTATVNSTYTYGANNKYRTYREPEILSASDSVDNADKFTLATIKNAWDADYYQKSFNKMVESVIEYKGFYVGRYEMSNNTTTNKAESTAGAKSVYYRNWWSLYEEATTYSTSGVISEMIWGCQYDAMMRWMQGNNIDVTSKTPTDTNRNEIASRNTDTKRITGSSSSDILNNVYDILGNSYEWTQGAHATTDRSYRGGYHEFAISPSKRSGISPTAVGGGDWGSRFTLYVEV